MTSPQAYRSVRSFPVETWYSGVRNASMALEPIECQRCGHKIPPGAHFTHGGRAPHHPLCYTCVPFFLTSEARKWLRPPVKPIRSTTPTTTPQSMKSSA